MVALKKFIVIAIGLLCSGAGIFAMEQGPDSPLNLGQIKEYNEKLMDAARRGDLEILTSMASRLGRNAELCNAIGVAAEANQLSIIKTLAEWCCCKDKQAFGFEVPPAGAGILVNADALQKAAATNSAFLPPAAGPATFFSSDDSGLLKVDTSLEVPGNKLLLAVNAGDNEGVKNIIESGEFPANGALLVPVASLESLRAAAQELTPPAAPEEQVAEEEVAEEQVPEEAYWEDPYRILSEQEIAALPSIPEGAITISSSRPEMNAYQRAALHAAMYQPAQMLTITN